MTKQDLPQILVGLLLVGVTGASAGLLVASAPYEPYQTNPFIGPQTFELMGGLLVFVGALAILFASACIVVGAVILAGSVVLGVLGQWRSRPRTPCWRCCWASRSWASFGWAFSPSCSSGWPWEVRSVASERSSVDSEQSEGGRWGRTPYRPEDLKAEYELNESGKRLAVTCPGCGEDWYPLPTCCVRSGSRTSSPFCQHCGVDFRADPEDVTEYQRLNVAVRDGWGAEKIRQLVASTDGLSIDGESTFFREEKSRNGRSRDTGSDRPGGEAGGE